MKTITLVSAAILIATAALAAEPAKKEGKIYTDQKGMTLYTFDKDEKNKSNCNGDCAKNWPPFMAKEGDAPYEAFTVIERKDDSYQWAMNGKPLYFFIGDKKPGDATGDGIKDVWDAARP